MENQLFLFSDSALYTGPVQDNGQHRHHALQIVVAPEPFTLVLGERTLRQRCALIGSDVDHALHGLHPAQSLLLLFRESSTAERLTDQYLQTDDVFVPERAELDDTLFRFAEINETPGTCSGAREHCARILSSSFDLPANSTTSPDARITRARQFIAEQEDLKVTLLEVAAHVDLSEGRLTHLFKEQVGIPIRRYIMWLRVQQAIRVAASGASLTDSAHAAGFADQAHFSRTFRDMFGFSPQESLSRRKSVNVILCPDDT